ncbi:MAG: hypothetical protein RLZZ135_2159 [Cyanobacteriota bacterium]|jgi:uncharacterized protein YgiM (DUF1202 family)
MHTQKLIVSLAITTVALVAQIFPAVAQSKSIETAQVGPGSYSNNVNTTYTCTVQVGDKVNIRSGPGKNYRILNRIKSGVYINTYDGTQGQDGFIWRKVNYRGAVGWIRGDYLCD